MNTLAASKSTVPILLLILLLLISLLIPWLTSNTYFLHILILIFIWTIAVSGMNIIAGFTGQLSLAQAGFFGIGAYTYGLLMSKANLAYLPSLFIAILLTGIIGAAAGVVSLRTKGHYFSIFSLCVGVIILLVIEKWESLTEGVRGLLGIPIPKIGSFEFASVESQYYLILFFLVFAMFLNHRIVNSLVGRTFVSIRNSEELAEALGINVMRNKLLAFVHSTVLAGLAGALYAGYIRFLGPEVASVEHTFEMLLYLLVGGIGTLWGPLVGTALVTVLMQLLQSWQEYRMVIFGPLLVLLVMYLPYGIIGAFIRQRMKRQAGKAIQETDENMQKGTKNRKMSGGGLDA
ncbi:branched-chain amino acid ABC transporter permease [Effusibacillus lacus]|uniref:Branched-chain amino acid ABC transporter permease n=1 Tax=Effusibacillus lacus TaxID=1348429 RepID=A0A292YLK6_9BACL|nr:branched-chain amino acid ABC transporter permease [Effusibacillus lacus]TCS75356.1 amino acid/amide ABC transporter membrane protein 2 (HAAT family) [Effusibacillus lacus]GAX89789.1 branched-chain amino acid ABC transporter permease [Effusibacillus lacus]